MTSEHVNSQTELSWPPPFILQRKARIRAVRLRICPERGLMLTVPKCFNAQQAVTVLEEHKVWIERTWRRIQPRAQSEQIELPQQLDLTAINEIWFVSYHDIASEKIKLRIVAPNQLLLSGDMQNLAAVKIILQRWLQQYAQQHLSVWLARLSQQTGFSFTKVSVRSTRTRWGSCSAKKQISLNCKLLFLAANVVQYVLLHELCHTIHFDHSSRFWGLLAQYDPEYQRHRSQLSNSHQQIPAIFCCADIVKEDV